MMTVSLHNKDINVFLTIQNFSNICLACYQLHEKFHALPPTKYYELWAGQPKNGGPFRAAKEYPVITRTWSIINQLDQKNVVSLLAW